MINQKKEGAIVLKFKITKTGVKNALKILGKAIGRSLIITSLLIVVLTPIYMAKQVESYLGALSIRVELMDLEYYKIYRDLSILMRKGFETAFDNDNKQLDFNQSIIDLNKSIMDNIDLIVARLNKKHSIDVDKIEDIKDANILIRNNSLGIQGSGSHIKIGEESYILTCAHLMKKDTNKLIGIIDSENRVTLKIVKYNKKIDIMLLKPVESMENIPYLEISETFPLEGSEILVIGNPASMIDLVTEGVIAKINKNHYVVTNLIYFGNSGGCVLYKGKIVGIVNTLRVYHTQNVFVNYGYAVKLEIIKDFLDGV